MHPYLPHLISDIKAAHRAEIFEQENIPQSLEEHFEEIEAWVRGDEAEHTFGYHCGLRSEIFPPPEQLSEKEMKLIRKEFERLMYTWNIYIDLPEKLPENIAYKMILDTLDSKTMIADSGWIGFDFCSGNAPECIFKEYCPCLEILNNPPHIDISSIPDNYNGMYLNDDSAKPKEDFEKGKENSEDDIPW